jgi:2,4-dienoyl-CoA reductase (NADPH2)
VTELLEPVALGARTARNRVVFGPHETNLARRRSVSERHVAYYRRRAVGGAGTIVVEEASVHPSDWPYERCPLAAESAEGWAAVAAACHAEGALVLGALGHAGGQGSSAYSQSALWAPSRVPEVASREVPKWMEAEDIAAVVEGFAAAAGLAAEAGLDGVEVNAGQHSLLRQFLSGLTNHRDDEWGADRASLTRTVLRRVRDAAPGLVVGLRLSCDELAPWAGLVPEAAAVLAGELAPLVDYLTVVRGSIFTVSATRPDTHTEPGFNRPLVRLVGAAVREAASAVPIVAQGSIVDPVMAEDLVAGGQADLVEMTRAQIADPDLVAKVSRGDAERVRPCILCNQWCQVRDARNPIVGCVGEPASGREWEPEWAQWIEGSEDAGGECAERAEPLLVVGGGPGGLECARTAATAGRPVTLVERQDRLGGAVRSAASAVGRERLAALVDWLEAECRVLGVTIRAGETAGPDDVRGHQGPVVLCTGSVPGEGLAGEGLAGEGPQGPRVADAATVLEEPPAVDGAVVVVWDPVGGPVGVSVAETLAGRGAAVTLVTPDPVVGQELARSGDLAPANVRLHGAGVAMRKHTVARAVTDAGVVVEHRFTGERETLPATLVVDAGHRLPARSLHGDAHAGDAVAPRGVGEAILEGRRAALAVERVRGAVGTR